MAGQRDIHDFYFKEAKREGYYSRAAYKLIEIDDRRHLLAKGQRVLDCGCAPGSWLQVAATRVGPRGRVVGVDLKEIKRQFAENVVIHQDDMRTIEAKLLRDGQPHFDVVLSDMAPTTTGDRTIDHHGSIRLAHLVLDRCGDLLKRGGATAIKIFEGEAYPEVLERARARFANVKGFKPKASRNISTEIYLVATDFDPDATDPVTEEQERVAPPRPSAGWGS